ncbi:DUF4326 domain-containing protein [Mesorhizobium sp. KR9-304]|uniref:DUF4326 domain-containing protein n=1 Tax=Mesorhizobium sp. KR9-304 TaxID=3156614 RepID=UPI0032B5099A
MITPVRLQLSRRAGFNLQAHSLATNGLPAANVARPTKWGNPHHVLRTWYHGGFPALGIDPFDAVTAADADREGARIAVALFRQEAERRPEAFSALRGKNLACWCKLKNEAVSAEGANGETKNPQCHADVLLELANRK